MKHIMTSLLTLLLSFPALAALLTPQGTSESKIEKVSLAPAANATVEGETINLKAISAGMRMKKVLFVEFKVYVAELFASSPESFKKNESQALASLKGQKAVAIKLHFVRAVEAKDVQKSFADALKINKIDVNDGAVKQFLDATKNGKAEEGKALTVLGATLKDGSEVIFYETTGGEISEIKGPAGFIEKIFSIWLGRPADVGLAELKKQLLK